MKNSIWNTKIPTFLGLILIVIGIGLTTFLINQTALFRTKASLSDQPQNVRITNITDNTFSVSYITSEAVIGSINYGTSTNFGQTGLDDRDQQTGELAAHTIHTITVRSLSPQTAYYFKITSGQNIYQNNDQPFTVLTGQTIQTPPPAQTPITGKIILPNGNAPQEALVYVTTDGASVVSALAKPDGNFIVPLNSIRTSDLNSYYSLTNDTKIDVLAVGDSLSSSISLSLTKDHSIPTITLSKNYDFLQEQSSVPNPTEALSAESLPALTSTSSATNDSPQILTPEQNQNFTDQQPNFKGKAIPNQSVQIIIHSDAAIQTKVTTDANGNWTYRPTTPLSPGKHTITILAKDANGVVKSITQSFVVYAAGTQINPAIPTGRVTPSPKTTPTSTPIAATPTNTPTPKPTITSIAATATPTLTIIPTATLIAQAPSNSTQSATITIPVQNSLPQTGNASIITAGMMGIIAMLIGGLLFLLTRGGI